MGSFKGFSLLVSASSTESQGFHFRVSSKLAMLLSLPMMLLLVLVVSIFSVSLYGFGKVTFLNMKISRELAYRNKIHKELAELKTVAAQYQDSIKLVVENDRKRRLTYGLAPLDSDMLRAGIGGTPLKSTIAIDNNASREVISALKLQESFQLYSRQSRLVDSTLSVVKEQIESEITRMRETPSLWPARGRSTSKYGYRHHPVLNARVFHDGYDIANSIGTPVYAPADGIVTKAKLSTGGYGKVIELHHESSNFKTKYAHLNDMLVNEGDTITRGQHIGNLGNTGRSTGPHLHYEVLKIKNGYFHTTDPEKFMIAKLPESSNEEG